MSKHARSRLWLLWLIAAGGAMTAGAGLTHAQGGPVPAARDTAPTFTVDGQVALHSFMSLSDAHLRKLADVLTILATTDAVRSGEWERIRGPLAQTARMTVSAAHWFARADGSYWTLEQGRATGSLADRAYFPRALAGQTVIGELVVSRSTNRNTAIVAVPVRGRDDAIVGVLGSSVHLDSLGTLLRREMGGLERRFLFFAIDSQPLGALNSDPALIFTEPMSLGDEGMRQAFTRILATQSGVVTYDFRGGRRTVLYRRSPVTRWWYGFGVLRPATRDASSGSR